MQQLVCINSYYLHIEVMQHNWLNSNPCFCQLCISLSEYQKMKKDLEEIVITQLQNWVMIKQ